MDHRNAITRVKKKTVAAHSIGKVAECANPTDRRLPPFVAWGAGEKREPPKAAYDGGPLRRARDNVKDIRDLARGSEARAKRSCGKVAALPHFSRA
jgi:hypothetical protein